MRAQPLCECGNPRTSEYYGCERCRKIDKMRFSPTIDTRGSDIARNNQGGPTSLLMTSIQSFKHADRWRHGFGDEPSRSFASLLDRMYDATS